MKAEQMPTNKSIELERAKIRLESLVAEILAVLQNPANKDHAIGSDLMRFVANRWQAAFDEIARKDGY